MIHIRKIEVKVHLITRVSKINFNPEAIPNIMCSNGRMGELITDVLLMGCDEGGECVCITKVEFIIRYKDTNCVTTWMGKKDIFNALGDDTKVSDFILDVISQYDREQKKEPRQPMSLKL